MRDIHRHHLVDPSYRPFDERDVAAAIMKEGSSTAQGPDGLSVLHLRHLGEHGLAFLTELFYLLVAGVGIPAIWKNSVIILILKARKLLSPTVKILERLLLPTIVGALGTRFSQHGFKPRHPTTSTLLPISDRVIIWL